MTEPSGLLGDVMKSSLGAWGCGRVGAKSASIPSTFNLKSDWRGTRTTFGCDTTGLEELFPEDAGGGGGEGGGEDEGPGQEIEDMLKQLGENQPTPGGDENAPQ